MFHITANDLSPTQWWLNSQQISQLQSRQRKTNGEEEQQSAAMTEKAAFNSGVLYKASWNKTYSHELDLLQS